MGIYKGIADGSLECCSSSQPPPPPPPFKKNGGGEIQVLNSSVFFVHGILQGLVQVKDMKSSGIEILDSRAPPPKKK